MSQPGDHLNWELSMRLAGGNSDLAREMLEMLTDALPEQIRALEAAAADRDLERARDAAHAIRGAAAYCGVPRLQLAARVVEEAVDTGEPTLVAAETDLLRRHVEALLDAWRGGRLKRSPE